MGSCRLYTIQLIEALMNMITDLENCIKLINDNGGFTVVMYKRCVINEISLIASLKTSNDNGRNTAANNNTNEEYIQLDSGEISYYIISINTTNHESLDPNYQFNRYLGSLKFNIKKIENTPTV